MNIIDRYKRLRSEAYLKETYGGAYAFVGLGQHSLTNLYPVLHYLQVPLKYICVTSESKARLIEAKFHGVRAVTDLGIVLDDPEVRGVFVAASPSAQPAIARRVLLSGKALFVEKPPCRSAEELETLIAAAGEGKAPLAMAGLQKRYAPAVRLLKGRLKNTKLISYDLHYCTGAYPEGDALTDLFIHPLDLVCHLFGKAEILLCRKVDGGFLLTLSHGHISGSLELSTAYSWADAKETLSVNTASGCFMLEGTDSLLFTPRPASAFGMPLEKTGLGKGATRLLFTRDSFSPVPAANAVYTGGFYDELHSFAEAAEGRWAEILTGLESLRDTYEIIDILKQP